MVEEYVTVDVAGSRNRAYTGQRDIPSYVVRGRGIKRAYLQLYTQIVRVLTIRVAPKFENLRFLESLLPFYFPQKDHSALC